MRLAPTYSGLVNLLRMIDRPERGLVYVVEMAGRVKAIESATGKVTTVLDYVAKARKDGSGFLGAAVHPTGSILRLDVDSAELYAVSPRTPAFPA